MNHCEVQNVIIQTTQNNLSIYFSVLLLSILDKVFKTVKSINAIKKTDIFSHMSVLKGHNSHWKPYVE